MYCKKIPRPQSAVFGWTFVAKKLENDYLKGNSGHKEYREIIQVNPI